MGKEVRKISIFFWGKLRIMGDESGGGGQKKSYILGYLPSFLSTF